MSAVKIPTDSVRRGLALFQAHEASRVYDALELEDLTAAFAWIADQSRADVHEIRINYDDDQLNVVDKINKALKAHGLVLVDDNLSHDGYCLFTLQAIKSNP